MSNVVAFGYGKRITTRGSGPASFGYGGYIFVPLRIVRASQQRNNQGALQLKSLVRSSIEVQMSASATAETLSATGFSKDLVSETVLESLTDSLNLQPDLGVASRENTQTGVSSEGAQEGVTVKDNLTGTTVDPAEPSDS